MKGLNNQPFGLLVIFVILNGTVARQVQINGNITEKIGTNGTMLTCNLTLDHGDHLISVWMLATNMTLRDFENVAYFDPDFGSKLKPYGTVLFGNASLSSVNKSSKSVSLSFDDLNCKHSRLYKYKLLVKTVDYPNIITESEAIGISIQVPPSKPDSVSLFHTPADVSVSSTSNIDYSSASPSTVVTSTENETVSASETGKQNTASVSNNFKIPTPGPNTTSSLLQEDISTSFRTTTYYIPKSTTAQGIVEGDNITVVCTGDVGNPKGIHFFQKYRNGKIVHMHEKVYATLKSEVYKNCSFYQTSILTFKITAADNNVVIRCAVNSSMAEPDMYVETEPIEVFYPVRMPTIISYQNKTDYVLGEDTSIHLACKSDGNPKPSYFWYTENPKQQVSSFENFTLTNLNVTNSGTYTCKVNNTFHGDTYQKATFVNIKIINTEEKLSIGMMDAKNTLHVHGVCIL
ncbi:uncharacterized protein LOC134726122 [Mytilus trossulus]|uniref:uncharacterized protein LOC134726122 n=1 Tax=Mytilus trossulus TaxID=6551 RepID=UPI003005ABFF